VWSWNTCVALVCGNTVVWKPSELTPLTALGCHALLMRAVADVGAPSNVHRVVLGGREVGEALVEDNRVAVVSATGSTDMGRTVAPKVAGRMGRYLLGLGGNNAAVVAPSADLDLVVRGSVFAAAGTAGQRCTTLRRLIVHEDVVDQVTEKIVDAYGQLRGRIGDPYEEATVVGPLGGERGCKAMRSPLPRPTVGRSWPAVRGVWWMRLPMPITWSLRWCACPHRPRWYKRRPLRRFCT